MFIAAADDGAHLVQEPSQGAHPGAEEYVVAQHQGRAVAGQERLADQEGLGHAVGAGLHRVVHGQAQVGAVAEVVDVLQVPAFLCRQTDLVVAVARSGRGVNLKKGQFVAPLDMVQAARKATDAGNPNVLVTERGASFGYHNLVVDMRGLYQMRAAGLTVCFDATHSVQLPSAQGTASGGERNLVPVLARAAVAAGVDALFAEVHETPDSAPCDGPCSLTPDMFETALREVVAIRLALGN